MHTNYSDFEYFDFHDSYLDAVEWDTNRLIWYLEGVNVLPQCKHNPYDCSMRASRIKLEFVDYQIKEQDLDFQKMAEQAYEILEVQKRQDQQERHVHVFCMESRIDYLDVELSFKDILFTWEQYEAKAWYVYIGEQKQVEQFLSANPHLSWTILDNEQGGKIVMKWHHRLSPTHALYRIEAMALAESNSHDKVLFSMDCGTCVVAYVSDKEDQKKQDSDFYEFATVEKALLYIKEQSLNEKLL